MKQNLQETSARSENDKCYTMEINAWKTPYADGIARICAYQQSRRHVYFMAIFTISLSIFRVSGGLWLRVQNLWAVFCSPTWPISQSCLLCLHDVRESETERQTERA
jgi:hypothetical protein